VYDGRIATLRRFKDDVREVQAGFECGITLENFMDVKEGDVIEVYEKAQVERTLS
jgi:translation initiation factor IF-2